METRYELGFIDLDTERLYVGLEEVHAALNPGPSGKLVRLRRADHPSGTVVAFVDPETGKQLGGFFAGVLVDGEDVYGPDDLLASGEPAMDTIAGMIVAGVATEEPCVPETP